MLALKKNHKCPYFEVEEYFQDEDFQRRIQESGGYYQKADKAHGREEIREYYQTDDIN